MNLIQKPSNAAAARKSFLDATAIREGLDSGPAESLDMEAILLEARADYQRRKDAPHALAEAIVDVKCEAQAKELMDADIDCGAGGLAKRGAIQYFQKLLNRSELNAI